jgi:hypothetical protein
VDGARSEPSVFGLVEVGLDHLKLMIGLAVVISLMVDAMLFGNELPELGSNLVPTLSYMHADYFPH